MIHQQCRHIGFVKARAQRALHAAEKFGHRIRIEIGLGQGLDADPVGFGFVGAGEIDLQLRRQTFRRGDGADVGIAGAVRALVRGRDQRADHRQHHQRCVFLLGFHRAHQMLLGNMRNLMREHGGQFVFVAGGGDKSCIHADKTAGQGKGVDRRIAHHEKREGLVGTRAV